MTVSISTRRRVGRTSLELPIFGFGAAHLGELYGKVDEAESRATLEAAWNSGVRFYDTAPWYGRGLSEHRLGGFLRQRPRDEFIVNTKVGRILRRPDDPATFSTAPWAGGLPFDVVFDYTYDGIMRAYEQVLQRLALNTVDSLVIHDLDTMFHTPEAVTGFMKQLTGTGMKALEELKRHGHIKAIGVGNNVPGNLDEMLTEIDVDFAIVAVPYTLLDQSVLDTSMKRCLDRGIGVIIGAPFASGILVTGSGAGAMYAYGKAPPEVQAKVRGIEAVCTTHSVSMPAAALQFVLAHPAVVSVIPGAAKPSEVRANVAALDARIPGAFWADLKSQGLLHPAAPVPA
ncbi:aldo/keto reductase [Mesorhizobium sp. BAC0120]|uniref:aldo/keto reductase n=1 Tax=Mesorhizobium sp. BAC0120 TaxID=3090670 RepID=UPI00298C9C31|nr:aldo/keto reductase [Mesorhizobium sp. BAC0120]MDW6025205.1 aldo/keto reductase [Mesorhizobium sp. BAC0120]